MNLNGNEKLIAQLFVEMSREDTGRAPQFESVLSSTRVPRRERNWSIAFAAALAMLIMAVVIGLFTARRTSKPAETQQSGNRAEVLPVPAESRSLGPDRTATMGAAAPKPMVVVRHRRHRQSPDQLAIQLAVIAKSLSEWQSPTASLLTYPGEDLFKTLPRLGDTLETIKSLSTDQFN
jgi:hypothetical protein